LGDVGRVAVTDCFKLKVFFTFIFADLLHLLVFRVDVDCVLTYALELKIVRLPSLECLCKCFGDVWVPCELK